MGTEKHFHIVELLHLLMVDGDEPHLAQAFALHAVVDDIAETVKGLALGKFFLGFLDGSGHSKAEAAAVVDLNLDH